MLANNLDNIKKTRNMKLLCELTSKTNLRQNQTGLINFLALFKAEFLGVGINLNQKNL